MLENSYVFSGFSVNDIEAAKKFYADTLGLKVSQDWMGLMLTVNGGQKIFVYQKDDHQAATYTVLNFAVDDLDSTVDDLVSKGVRFERYDNLPASQDEKGILRGKAANQGPDIAWFKDPAGNVFAVLSK